LSILPFADGSKKYFLGTSVGLFSADSLEVHTNTSAGTKWKREAPNLLGHTVVNMIETREVDGLVVVATHGQGVFSANFKTVVSTKNISDVSAQLKIAPNPATERACLDLSALLPFEKNGLTIRIFDLNGRLIQSYSSIKTEQHWIEMHDWQRGTYLVSVEGKAVKKLIKY
jgi:hypothetical protein